MWLEIIDDPKMGRLPDWLWRRAIELFLLAGENGNDGLLQPVTDLAWRLRTPEEKLTESLVALSEVGVVHETPRGWVVTHFKERQEPVSSTERVRLFRQRERNYDETEVKRKSNKKETEEENDSASASVYVSDSGSSEERGTGGETGNVFTVYEHNIGILTPMIADALKDAEKTYGPVWICAAIQEAVANNARSWKYCEAILQRWARDGFKSAKKNQKGDSFLEKLDKA